MKDPRPTYKDVCVVKGHPNDVLHVHNASDPIHSITLVPQCVFGANNGVVDYRTTNPQVVD